MELPAGSTGVTMDALGRKDRVKGYVRPHKEMRKVVPKHRRFDRTKANDLICLKAYEMDMTRQELADKTGLSRAYVNKLLITAPKCLKPVHIKQFAEVLGMTEEETRRVYHAAAVMQGYIIGPYSPE